jgi:hypothetical protein
MDEQNQSGPPPQHYTWPRYVLGGVILGIVLAFVWMAVLVHRVRGQREDMKWPTSKVASPTTVETNQTATNTAAGH